MLSPKKLLENARNRIAKRENWTTSSLATDGRQRVSVLSPTAVNWCAIGAVAAEAGVEQPYSVVRGTHYAEALKALANATGLDYEPGDSSRLLSTVYSVNDFHGHEATLDMFDIAIASMKGE